MTSNEIRKELISYKSKLDIYIKFNHEESCTIFLEEFTRDNRHRWNAEEILHLVEDGIKFRNLKDAENTRRKILKEIGVNST